MSLVVRSLRASLRGLYLPRQRESAMSARAQWYKGGGGGKRAILGALHIPFLVTSCKTVFLEVPFCIYSVILFSVGGISCNLN